MKEIFYSCRCTGQSFTREEWWKYLDEHKNDTDESVHRSGKFGYNIHDVCLNPNTFYLYNRGEWSFKVTTNMVDSGKWTYGIEVNLHNRSWLFGGGYCDDDECFGSESDAAKKGLEDIMNYIDKVIESDNTVSHIPSQIKSMIDEIKSKLAKLKMKQLELFTV